MKGTAIAHQGLSGTPKPMTSTTKNGSQNQHFWLQSWLYLNKKQWSGNLHSCSLLVTFLNWLTFSVQSIWKRCIEVLIQRHILVSGKNFDHNKGLSLIAARMKISAHVNLLHPNICKNIMGQFFFVCVNNYTCSWSWQLFPVLWFSSIAGYLVFVLILAINVVF